MKVQKMVEIKAPPEKIWPYLIVPEKVLQWCITYKKFEYAGDQRSGVGTPLYIEEQAGGGLTKMQFIVTEWEENARLALQMISGASYKSYRQELTLEPIQSGSRFTFMEEIILPYGIIGRLIGLLAERMSSATVDKMFLKLKDRVEA